MLIIARFNQILIVNNKNKHYPFKSNRITRNCQLISVDILHGPNVHEMDISKNWISLIERSNIWVVGSFSLTSFHILDQFGCRKIIYPQVSSIWFGCVTSFCWIKDVGCQLDKDITWILINVHRCNHDSFHHFFSLFWGTKQKIKNWRKSIRRVGE